MSQPRRLLPGDAFPQRTLVTFDSSQVAVPDPNGALVHLQLRRYAGCPICNLHLRSFSARHAELVAAGVREVAVFHSTAGELREAQAALPFPVVPDPQRLLYAELGVGTSARAVLDPRAWGAAMRAVATGASAAPTAGITGGMTGLPADFLVASDGRVVASKYGLHADDHWSVDEVLALTRDARGAAPALAGAVAEAR